MKYAPWKKVRETSVAERPDIFCYFTNFVITFYYKKKIFTDMAG